MSFFTKILFFTLGTLLFVPSPAFSSNFEPYFQKVLEILARDVGKRANTEQKTAAILQEVAAAFPDADTVRLLDIEARDVLRNGSCWSKAPTQAYLAAIAKICADRNLPQPALAPKISLAEVRALFWRLQTEQLLGVTEKTVAYVLKESPPWQKLKKELQGKLAAEQPQDWSRIYTRLAKFRRGVLLSHPDLQFKQLLVNQHEPPLYSHNCDQYLGRHSRAGAGIALLENWQSNDWRKVRKTEPLANKLPTGDTTRPNLSYDANRVVFSFCDHTTENRGERRFFLYEATLDGKKLRQITGTKNDPMEGWGGRTTVGIEDFDPSYLPDGGIVFTSTRSQCFGRCHGRRYTPSYLLYRVEPDGSDLHQISYGEANEHFPSVLNDGRIVFTRWEYINRNQIALHKLWAIKPDGTGISNFYGVNTLTPWSNKYHDSSANPAEWYKDIPPEIKSVHSPFLISETRAIPHSQKVVATGGAHHSYTCGSLVIIDPEIGEDGHDAIRKLTPETPYAEAEDYFTVPGKFETPFPVNEELFFAGYSPLVIHKQRNTPPAGQYGIYLVDVFGGREPIWREKASTCSPMPVIPREKPPVLPQIAPFTPPKDVKPHSMEARGTGTLVIQNVYLTRNDPEGLIKPDSIKHLRVIEVLPLPKNGSRWAGSREDFARKILGTVPVEKDGSVIVNVPAKTAIHLQLLDAKKMAVLTERTLFHIMPGEVRSCVGCHEQPGTPPVTDFVAMRRQPAELTPPVGPKYPSIYGFSFRKSVQPVLDRYCIKCHGLNPKKMAGDINLLAGVGPGAKVNGMPTWGNIKFRNDDAYISLTTRPGLIKQALRKGNQGPESETPNSRPFDYYAHASRLAKQLHAGRCGVPLPEKLDADSLLRITQWLDLNVVRSGDYAGGLQGERTKFPGDQEKALRLYLREHFPNVPAQEWSDAPLRSLVNTANLEESRVLMAPLAKEAGGWGQIKPFCKSKQDAGYREVLGLIGAGR